MLLYVYCLYITLMCRIAFCAPYEESGKQNKVQLEREEAHAEAIWNSDSQGALDSAGGVNLLGADDSSTDVLKRRMMPEVREDKSTRTNSTGRKWRTQSSGTLDSIGGGHLIRASGHYMEGHFHRPSNDVSPLRDDRESMMSVDREDKADSHNSTSVHKKPDYPPSGTLDSIGGGNFVRSLISFSKYEERGREFDEIDNTGDFGGLGQIYTYTTQSHPSS